MPVLFGGHNLPLLVEIVLTDLPKSEMKLKLLMTFPHQFDRNFFLKFFVWGVRDLSGISDNWGSFGGVYPGLPLGV